MTGTLVVCATPIGNLDDASPRLATSLRQADVVYAEDTRRSQTLLRRLGIDRRLRSYFAGNERARAEELARHLESDKTVALITDAGMPGISDPGFSAVRVAVDVGAIVTVVPGPSAVTAAIAVSGLRSERFAFEGFLPRKGGARATRLAELAAEPRTMVVFASPERVERDLADLADALGSDRPVAITRELTKLHEEVWRGTLAEALAAELTTRGEITIVLAGAERDDGADLEAAITEAADLVERGVGISAAARIVADQFGVRRRAVYEALLRSQKG